jgi:hypothetical protein
MNVERSDVGVFVHAAVLTATGSYLPQVVAADGRVLMGLAVGLGVVWLAMGYVAALVVTTTGSALLSDLFQAVLPLSPDGTVSRPNARVDLALGVYNAAVVMLGSYLVTSIGITDPVLILGLAVGLGLVWTAYFTFGMADRLERLREGRLPEWVDALIPDDEPDPDEIEEGGTGSGAPAAASGDGYEEIQAPWESDEDS